MHSKPSASLRILQRLAVTISAVALMACGGGASVGVEPPTDGYALGGTVSGLSASGLVLANAGDTATVSSGASTFDFATLVHAGAPYSVTVKSAPVGLICSVANGSGIVGMANVSNVVVRCADQSYSLGGSISGLTTTGLVLANGADQVTVPANAGTFTLPAGVAFTSSYAVSVTTQPVGLICSVANGSGTVGTANVSNVVVTCSDLSYSLGGSISGLTTAGLVLANGPDQVAVPANAGTFMLPTRVAFTSSYAVTVAAQPVGLSCSVANGSGSMTAGDINNVVVTCSDQAYTLGGTVHGLSGTGLVLANGSDSIAVPANATSFMLPTPVAFTQAYAVTVTAQPVGLTCTVSAGSGVMPAANVTTVAVVCSDRSYSLGGTISGLTATGLVLANGSDTLRIPANAIDFTLPTPVAFTSGFAVTVKTQPTNLNCTVSMGSGTMPAANVSSVVVTCSYLTFTLGGTITGLTASGLILTDGIDRLSVASNAAIFSMPTGVAYGSSYAVTVAAQPAGLSCGVTGGTGVMPASNVGSVQVTCAAREWVWEGGSTTDGSSAMYGTLGTAAAGNVPGPRDSTMYWSDGSGIRWMFGGAGTDAAQNGGLLNDLWSYDPSTHWWTWVGGSNSANPTGIYGTLGVAATANIPGGRVSAMIWTNSPGQVWMFGGYGNDSVGNSEYLNDLWTYSPSTHEWTWMSGSNLTDATGVYGTQGVAAAGNVPGARQQALSWTGADGRLWLFGGSGYGASGAPNYLSDLWVYDPTTQMWTWVSGSTGANATGVYGTQGVASSSNAPGARSNAMNWTDSAGHLWLFGGGGIDSVGGNGRLNDLWSYDTTLGQWTWVKGSNTIEAVGVYGTQGITAVSNSPGARVGGMSVIDSAGHLWLFGGFGPDAAGNEAFLDDLWSYDPRTQGWTWVSGPSTQPPLYGQFGTAGVYGTLDVAAPSNIPGSRLQGAVWIDSSDSLWLFGGYAYDVNYDRSDVNDLWKY